MRLDKNWRAQISHTRTNTQIQANTHTHLLCVGLVLLWARVVDVCKEQTLLQIFILLEWVLPILCLKNNYISIAHKILLFIIILFMHWWYKNSRSWRRRKKLIKKSSKKQNKKHNNNNNTKCHFICVLQLCRFSVSLKNAANRYYIPHERKHPPF